MPRSPNRTVPFNYSWFVKGMALASPGTPKGVGSEELVVAHAPIIELR
jgi:hypothetical protein